uniref:thioredoxin-dependent peroxiredoxin n=1 Tax=Spongospora subterranea TaxID=70186 RepID=A0A0H5QH71_9EUKA|eukprot:CRZ01311.1 hypothetical protein [Spongospora subterranea]
MVKVGDVAPNFSIPDQDGATISLSDFKGKRNVVIFFYPKDNTPGCTKEACSFRDNMAVFNELDAEVIGISNDTIESHKKFAEQFQLKFRLGSDHQGDVRKLYNVTSTFGIPGRVTFVVDKSGIIQEMYDSQIWMHEHMKRAKSAITAISAL